MKTLLFLLFPVLLSAQSAWEKDMQRRQRTFDKYEPSRSVGQAILPGLLGLAAGSIDTEYPRGRVAQQAIMFGAVVSIGSWGERPAKQRFWEGIIFIGGFALGTTIKQASQ